MGDVVKLKPMHQKFCLEYLKSGDGTKAYQTTYTDSTRDSAKAAASRLLRDKGIVAYLAEQREQISKKGIVDASEVLQAITDTMRNTDKEHIRLKAAAQLANILGMNKAASVTIPTDINPYSDLTDDQLQEQLNKLKKAIPVVIPPKEDIDE